MKRNILYKTVAVFTLTLSIASCTKLEENPVGLLAPESFFKTEADVEASVIGVYSRFSHEKLFGRKLPLTIMLMGDAVDIGDLGTSAERITVNNFTSDANNGMTNIIWPELYKSIGIANAAIYGAESIPNKDGVKAKQLKAEAMVLKALCYYYLVQLFGDIPYISDFVTEPALIANISKTPATEVFQYIIADCEYAAENLPDKYSGNIHCRPTKGSAMTLLASIYLTLGQYDKAAQYAEDVINNASAYGYALINDFTELWKADNGDQVEHIWTVDFKGGYSKTQVWWGALTGVSGVDMNGWSVTVASPGLYDLFEAGDHRMETTFVTEAPKKGVIVPYTGWQIPRIHFGKFCLYPGAMAASDGSYTSMNWPIFRFAEVYLIAAEALAEVNNGPTAKAYEYINKVRERARFGGTVPANLATGMSKADFINAVLKERLMEFPMEGKRWFDIKRRQLGDQVYKGPNSIEPHPNFSSSRDYLLALPEDELGRNPNLLPQNPGY